MNSADAAAQAQKGEQQDLYVAAGLYQLPLFKGLPSMALLTEMKRTGSVEGTLLKALKVSCKNRALSAACTCTMMMWLCLNPARESVCTFSTSSVWHSYA